MRFLKTAYRLAALLLFMTLALSGCSSIRNYRSANPYHITHHTWWNYYQRGRRYLQDENYTAARSDFETALGIRPGARYPYRQDRWKVRTYGMHMLESYFPHRELGICLFNLNAPSEALNLLETSMTMEPSARAKFYINRIHETQAMQAAPPPEISLTPAAQWTDQRTARIQGTVFGTNRITRLLIHGQPEFLELAENQIHFNKQIDLQEGRNLIQIASEDVAGKQSSTNLIMIADWTPPQIHLQRQNDHLILDCLDNLGLYSIQHNEHTIYPSSTHYSLPLPRHTNQPISITLTDHAGNKTAWSLSPKELAHIEENHPPAPPFIYLENAGQTRVQFSKEYTLDLRAEDDTALQSVTLNGAPLLSLTTPLFRTLRRVPLNIGTNNFSLAATDNEGNLTEKQVTVVYRPPEYLDRMFRLAALQAPLSGETENPDTERRVNAIMGESLTTDPVRFYLLAAPHENQQAKTEQTLSASAFCDARALLNSGKKLNADLLFMTRILNDAPGQTIYTQIIDAHNGEELFIEDIYVEDARHLSDQLNGLVMKIEQRFPLIQSTLEGEENHLRINAGKTAGAQKGMRFLVIRSNGTFEEGHLVVNEDHPVELTISDVDPAYAEVILHHGTPKDSVRPGDYVYSR